MTKYETLVSESEDIGVDVVEMSFQDPCIHGLYADKYIAINKHMTETQKACTIAEELGHHHTTSGNILSTSTLSNLKQERTARAWAVKKILKEMDIVKAVINGAQNYHEVAEALDVTESFLIEALQFFDAKKEPAYELKINSIDYVVSFYPLCVIPVSEIFELDCNEDIFF